MIKRRYLNIAYILEVLNGRLNGSAEQVETKRNSNANTTYVKKIGNRGVVSAPCQKKGIKSYMEYEEHELSKKIKVDKKISISATPHKFIDEDVFGFMRAESITISKEDYENLSDEEKKIYKKDGNKGYKSNVTKKRKSKFLMSSLLSVSNQKINTEWNVCSTDTESMPYNVETYSGIFVGISNMDINNIGKFKISDRSDEFRDYAAEEEYTEEELELSKEDRYKRIKIALKGLQHLSIRGNQNNYLTDTAPKLVILGEYKWGNNVFQGIIKKDGLDIEALKETLDENEEFRISNVWIGISKRIENEDYKGLEEELKKQLKEYDYVHIGKVKYAFDEYLTFLEKTME